MNKKRIAVYLVFPIIMLAAGCKVNGNSEETKNRDPISLISREDGSGTRSAFTELFGIEEENSSGEKEDMTSQEAQITNNTSVMMTTVADHE